MNEFQFIDSIKQDSYKQRSLQKGIGDDAAVFRSLSEDVVTAVDTFVENIHFTKKTANSYHIGYRCLAANISDMAAIGAEPKFYLVSVVVPKTVSTNQLAELYNGMQDIADQFQMDLIGGDTVTGDQLVVTVTIIGFVPRDKARYRSNARKNDIVFVTGTLGDSQAGLSLLLNEQNAEGKEYFIERHRKPTPRVHFSKSLQAVKRLALNDVSDGIANELQEIAQASDVTIVIEDDKIPVSPNFLQFPASKQYFWKYFGGEDFELVGTVPKEDWDLLKEKAHRHSLRLTKIGQVTYNKDSNGNVFVLKDNQLLPLKQHGYIHEVGE